MFQEGAVFVGPLPGWRLCGILVKGRLQNQTGMGLNPDLANHSVYVPGLVT